MMQKISGIFLLSALLCSLVYADNINGVDIGFADIGYANNSANTDTYGAVGYNYRISTYEITHAQFAPSGLGSGNENYWVTNGVGAAAAVVNITWHDAARYCNWLTSSNINTGAYSFSGSLVSAVTPHQGTAMDTLVSTYGQVYVLPTEDEWYKAAYYKPVNDGTYSLYANGTGTAPVNNSNALYSVAAPWAVDSGTEEQNETFNMMGNIWEYLESAKSGSLDLGDAGQLMAIRGGGFDYDVTYLGSDNRDEAFIRSAEYENGGIRIVEIVPEAGTLSLMSLSTVSLFLTRTIRRRKRLGQTLLPTRREYVCDSFCTVRGLEDTDYEHVDYLSVLADTIRESCVSLWAHVRQSFQMVDKAFWNRMVVVHERKVARRVAFRQALRKKAIDGFDAVLALIMK